MGAVISSRSIGSAITRMLLVVVVVVVEVVHLLVM
jgi:hypothetical protein